ncbi:MAG: aldolase/citrate lyase family protein [Sulfurimonas sp.]|uniref:HpcH/HpaI aldolase/citrate lyase family protein n=1 Tax=Sulfurimonas sp. TaxID=2022749 RepID=UPI0025EC591D|nr:aldolase/citrate lyase family protein [Sulfurimonas sp.]MCK9491225.1 aldolase/citrate lyase family protein [Sulfurimonas sp.]
MLNKILEAFKNRDVETLDAMVEPTFRVLNTRDDFTSALMLSCNKIKHLEKIDELEADCIILNLEDGVSKEDKALALALCAIYLVKHKECSKKLVVRVNALDEGGYDEIAYLNQFMPDAIRVSKIKTKKEVENILALLDEDIELHLSIETSEAWHNLATLRVSQRVTTFYLGILDLLADIKLPQNLVKIDNPTINYILTHFLVSSRAMGVKAVSFVYQEYEKLDEFSQWIEFEKSLGYDAKVCISPAQVALVNEAFAHGKIEINRAKEIVKLFEIQRDKGITGFTHPEYGFIDEPIYKGALALLM